MVALEKVPLNPDLPTPEDLRARRKEKGMTLEQLSQLIGRDPSWLSKIERGQMDLANAPYLVVRRYLQVLGFLG